MNGLHPTAVHEAAGHTAAARLHRVRVKSATIHADESGLTVCDFEGVSHEIRMRISLAGHIAERLLLDPSQIDVTRSHIDFEQAVGHAFEVAARLDRARHASRQRLQMAAADPGAVTVPVRTLDDFPPALVEERISALADRRRRHALRLVAVAEAEVTDLLDRHRCVMRTLAKALSDFHALTGEQVNELFELGMRRQVEDDRRYR